MGIGRLGRIGTSLLAGLLSCSTSPQSSGSPLSPEQKSNKTEPQTPEIRIRHSGLRSGDGYFKEMALNIDIEGDSVYDGIVSADLRSVVNIAPDEYRSIDPSSFSSMIARGTASETTFFLTKEAEQKIKKLSLEDKLTKIISPTIKIKIAREDYPKKESEAESVRIGNNGNLLPEQKPPINYYFRRPTISDQEKLPDLTKEEAQKIKSFGKRELVTCPVPLPGQEKKLQEDKEKYYQLRAEPILVPSASGGYSFAGIGIKFSRASKGYDILGVLDLRNVKNSREITENDLQAMAFWGDIRKAYCTAAAEEQIKESEYLRMKINSVFAPNLKLNPIDLGKKEYLEQGKLERFLATQSPEKQRYFHCPGIFPCAD